MKLGFDSVAFAKRLELLRGSQSERAFAKKLGITSTSYSNYIRGQIPGVDKVLAIAAVCDVSISWLLEGAPTTTIDGRASEQRGAGFFESIAGCFAASRLSTFQVAADNMDPTLKLGDTVFIDRDDKLLADCSIYALCLGNGIGLRRVIRQLSGTILLTNDNPIYLPETCDAALTGDTAVFGRVVSFGRSI